MNSDTYHLLAQLVLSLNPATPWSSIPSHSLPSFHQHLQIRVQVVFQPVKDLFKICSSIENANLTDGDTTGNPEAKKSIIIANTSGFIVAQLLSSALLIEMKFVAKNTDLTPLTLNNNFARGLTCADANVGKSIVPISLSSTSRPGKNLRLSGLGVSCVWMNIVRHWMRDCGGYFCKNLFLTCTSKREEWKPRTIVLKVRRIIGSFSELKGFDIPQSSFPFGYTQATKCS